MSGEIEKAIKDAIQLEGRVRDVYIEAERQADDEIGKHVLKVLADEEQRHLDYLNYRLEELQKTGKVTPEHLETVIPSKAVIASEVKKLQDNLRGSVPHSDAELQMLKKALQVEIETSEFYKRMVDELPGEGQKLFARFVEIEEGHRAIVQAEIDNLSGNGFWFDMREFDLEAGG